MSISGLPFSLPTKKDYVFPNDVFSHQEVTGPIGRTEKAQTLPVQYQGDQPLCVQCSLDFMTSWINPTKHRNFSLPITDAGIEIKDALYAYWKHGLIPNYYFIDRPNQKDIERALVTGPLLIGLYEWPLVPGGHAMVLLEPNSQQQWQCVNWMQPDRTDFVGLPFEQYIDFVVVFTDELNGEELRLSWLGYLWRYFLKLLFV